jgi:hypothetical protein
VGGLFEKAQISCGRRLGTVPSHVSRGSRSKAYDRVPHVIYIETCVSTYYGVYMHLSYKVHFHSHIHCAQVYTMKISYQTPTLHHHKHRTNTPKMYKPDIPSARKQELCTSSFPSSYPSSYIPHSRTQELNSHRHTSRALCMYVHLPHPTIIIGSLTHIQTTP